jgi:DedD protein
MAMEQQKTLWIVFSVTLFLLVVTVVGFIWFLPNDDALPDGAAVAAAELDREITAGYDPIEWARETDVVPGLEPSGEEDQSEDILLVYGETPIEEGNSDSDSVATTETAVTRDTITVAAPESKTTNVTAAGQDVAEVKATAPVVQTAPKERAVSKTVTKTQYWIQAGSYTSIARAKEVQNNLSESGWQARITTRDINDVTYYRVRIGPYEGKPEAEKFLGWLKGLETFETSYISQVYTTQTVN